MNWEVVLITAFSTVGLIEFVKGFFKEAKGNTWRYVQVAFVFLTALVATHAPTWVVTGMTALSVSQIGYDVIIDAVKKKLSK